MAAEMASGARVERGFILYLCANRIRPKVVRYLKRRPETHIDDGMCYSSASRPSITKLSSRPIMAVTPGARARRPMCCISLRLVTL
jgi:hypothetical protein